MTKHYIIMSSSYSDGRRIAFDITDESLLNTQAINGIISNIRSDCDDDVPLSTHFIETKDPSWESVVTYDPFFEGVECIQTLSEFSKKIKKDRVLSGLDVANYIASKIPCTHLSLQKLVYLAYADYLCSRSERLFEDNIYAFQYGPVVDSIFAEYKGTGDEYIDHVDDRAVSSASIKQMPAKSRILFAKNGFDKLQSIDKTIEKYGKYSASKLVDITHRAGSPWSIAGGSKAYHQVISDDMIKKGHSVECDKE
jgi:gepA protein